MVPNVPRAVVFSPSPLLTVTVEARADGTPDVHVHAGGQGVWLARMMSSLGVAVRLCAPFGGETGAVLTGLIERDGIELHASTTAGSSGAYIHDRRGGGREELVRTQPAPLLRHELDELVDQTLVQGLDADVVVLGGPDGGDVLPPVTYRRLAADLNSREVPVVADLSGAPLTAALDGGLTVLKVSAEDMVKDRQVDSDDFDALVAMMRRFRDGGADSVIVTRAADPALALTDDTVLEVEPPSFQTVDHRGAGDSLTAGIATALARGRSMHEALQLGGAAGSLNVTRHGLGTGPRDLIERLAADVRIRPR